MKRVAVIAGTPVDTQMGVDYLNKRNAEAGAPVLEPIYLPLSGNCDEHRAFQYRSYEEKWEVMDTLLKAECANGTRDFFIYCNSLSGAFDFDAYAAENPGLNICTPLHVYRDLGANYDCVGLLTANAWSVHAIETLLLAKNPSLSVIGSDNMTVVRAIERGESPQSIVDDYGLKSMIDYMKSSGAEALILGCTHFPYFKEELAAYSAFPLIDPADGMFERLMA